MYRSDGSYMNCFPGHQNKRAAFILYKLNPFGRQEGKGCFCADMFGRIWRSSKPASFYSLNVNKYK